MAKAAYPIRSPRRLYKVDGLCRKPGASTEEGSSIVPGYILMKRSIAEFLGTGFEELPADDPAWYFTRTIGGEEIQFRKNLGGYKSKRVHLHSFTGMEITEYITDPVSGEVSEEVNTFKSITIGLPAGVSMGRFFTVFKASSAYEKVDKIVTYDGKAIFVKQVAGEAN